MPPSESWFISNLDCDTADSRFSDEVESVSLAGLLTSRVSST